MKRVKLRYRYVVFILVASLYMIAIDLLGGQSVKWAGHYDGNPLILEIPVLIYLYYIFNLILKDNKYTPYVAALPIVLIYVVHDIVFLMWGKVARIIDIKELPELLGVLPPSFILIGFLSVFLPVSCYIAFINIKAKCNIIIFISGMGLLSALIIFFPYGVMSSIEKLGKINYWSDESNVRDNGRIAMAIYHEARRIASADKLSDMRNRVLYEKQSNEYVEKLKTDIKKKKNIHLIVLESFMDPMLLNAQYSQSPVHPAFQKYALSSSFSVSPVFGGRTAQAEFEVLCGVPAFGELTGIEFNSFTGAKVFCLPHILSMVGYRTVVSNAYKPNYFNSLAAYEGLGFEEIYFPKEYAKSRDTYLSIGDIKDEEYMFDGDLLEQNHAFLFAKTEENSSKPLFNYVIGVYGHFPHDMDEERRPLFIEVQAEEGDHLLSKYVNQYYYRTQALGEYLDKLVESDPESIIIVVSDHLPPLMNGVKSYACLDYISNIDENTYFNRIYIINDGLILSDIFINHYDVPGIILNNLSNGKYCAEKKCGFLDANKKGDKNEFYEKYLNIMAHATE